MKLTFISNLLHHHQTPLCDELYKILGDDFCFVSTIPFPKSMLKIGYKDESDSFPYNISSYKSDSNLHTAQQKIDESDVVIIGSAPDILIKHRLENNKLTFRYSERFYKKSYWYLLDPRCIRGAYLSHFRHRNKNLHMLCASAYTANDCDFIFSYPNKKYRWGYFTAVPELDIDAILESKCVNSKITILWVARYLDWKHPELVVELASRLRDHGYSFEVKMVGSGELSKKITNLILEKDLKDYVVQCENISNERVLELMRQSNIFVFTSDRGEGWGTVLNEAMASGCAVVASHEIGSAPYLIKNGTNGLLFKSCSSSDLYSKVELLLNDRELIRQLSLNAYKTMREIWHPRNAAMQLLSLSKSLLTGDCIYIPNGPCSLAEKTKIQI